MSFLISPISWILVGILFIFFTGSLVHFLYQLSKNNFLIGLFTPINESIWEHTKLGLVPTILWWAIYAIIYQNHFTLFLNSWFTGCLFSCVISIILIPMLFYLYTQAFGFQSLFMDIFIFLFTTTIAQLLGYHIYYYHFTIPILFSIIFLFLILLLYVFFTIYPPKLPLFRDPHTGTYGILKKKIG